jgi:hypothetical protein
MRPPAPDNDDTIRIPRGVPLKRRSLLKPLLAGTGIILVPAALGGIWFALKPTNLLSAPIPIGAQTEAQIDASEPCATMVSTFALDAAVIVIDFQNLTTQGLALDRVAALVEKDHLPRDRVLSDAELIQAIHGSGDTIESYYYGHDYQAADLAKFFRLAAQENIQLNPHELWLKALLAQLGWLKPGAVGAIITVPAASGPVTPDMRAVILHHEISHGAFYTNATYRRYAESFWYSLTDAARAAFTGFLGRQGYDTTNTELMLNETQAYLIFTRDPRFFNAQAVGMSDAGIAQLREGFIANMPDFWLRPLANAILPPTPPRTAQCQQARATTPRGTCQICAVIRENRGLFCA